MFICFVDHWVFLFSRVSKTICVLMIVTQIFIVGREPHCNLDLDKHPISRVTKLNGNASINHFNEPRTQILASKSFVNTALLLIAYLSYNRGIDLKTLNLKIIYAFKSSKRWRYHAWSSSLWTQELDNEWYCLCEFVSYTHDNINLLFKCWPKILAGIRGQRRQEAELQFLDTWYFISSWHNRGPRLLMWLHSGLK